MDTYEKRLELVTKFEQSRPPEDTREKMNYSLGEWFTDYIVGSGYWVEDSPIMFKQMIIRAFPPVLEGEELNVNNFQKSLINSSRIVHRYLDEEQSTRHNQALAHRVGRGGYTIPSSTTASHAASSVRCRRGEDG